MNEGQLLARLRDAEERIRQLEYRIWVLENQSGGNAQQIASLRSASAN